MSADDEREALAEAAYPSVPFYVSGTNPWPESFRDAFRKGWDARDRGRGPITDAAHRTAVHEAIRRGIENVQSGTADRDVVRAVADQVLSLEAARDAEAGHA